MLYQGYRAGRWLAMHLPVGMSYRLAIGLADLQYLGSPADRRAVQRNLAVILGPAHPDVPRLARTVFQNFAKYLVDFFRLERVDGAFITQRVTVVGRDYVDEALRRGRGAILMSAHVGNYELGGAIATALGYRLSAIVLSHRDPRIDAFFTRQRRLQQVHSIPVGMALRQGYACLKRNDLLAIVADRDFFENGVRMPFLGRTMSVPKGPALFAIRTGAPIVPAFLIRERGDRFQLIFERPIEPDPGADEAAEALRITQAGLAVLESYIRRYPDQWYLFRDFEHPGPWVIR